MELQQSGLHGLDFFLNVNENYGVEELGLPPEEAGNQVLSISDLQFHLMEDDLQQLQELVNPLQESHNYGIDLYLMTLQFVSECVRQNPHVYT